MAASPSFERTTKLVGRALGIGAHELLASFRPASSDDLAAVCDLRQRAIGSSIRWNDQEYLAWRYRLGRPGMGLGELWIMQWQGRLLGMIGAEAMECLIAGKSVVGQRAMDVLVAADVRESGLGVWMNQALFRHAAFTLAVGANENSIGTVQRLYHMLEPRRTYVHPVNFHSYVARRFGNPEVARVVATAGNVVMRCWRRIANVPRRAGLTIAPIDRFDARLDSFWEQSAQSGTTLLVDRRAAYMNRRLFDNPRARYQVWEVVKQGRRRGSMAARIVDRADGTFWLHVIDWHCDVEDDRASTLGILLSFMARRAVSERCTMVAVTLQGRRDRSVLRRHGYIPQAQDEATVVGLYVESELGEQLRAAEWSLTDLSVDHDGY